MLTLALVMLLGLFGDGFSTVSHAQSQGRVTATSARIRKEPSGSSEVVGSALQGKVITINNQVQGSDGYIWYQTFVDSETLGYIRSDLVEIIDGTTPATVTPVEPTAPEGNGASGQLEALNPVSATVKGNDKVRIRSGASTDNDIVTTVPNGLALTINGRITDGRGDVWYKVSFNFEDQEWEGFIRHDYVDVAGELTPYVEPTADPADNEPDPVEPEPEPEVARKDYDTVLIDGKWYLLDYIKNTQQDIEEFYATANQNAESYNAEHKKAETEKVVIIILVFLLVAAASGIAMLVFKIKDMSDDVYFSQVERETLRRRGEARSQGGSQKVMHTVGADKSGSGRPAGAKPAGTPQGQRPAGARPSGAPQGQRPAGAKPAGTPQGQRPAGARPSGAPQGQRPAGPRHSGAPQGQKPSGAAQESRSAESHQGQNPSGQKPAQGWQSKNFMSEDDDEFEFGFLNYDGTEEK